MQVKQVFANRAGKEWAQDLPVFDGVVDLALDGETNQLAPRDTPLLGQDPELSEEATRERPRIRRGR